MLGANTEPRSGGTASESTELPAWAPGHVGHRRGHGGAGCREAAPQSPALPAPPSTSAEAKARRHRTTPPQRGRRTRPPPPQPGLAYRASPVASRPACVDRPLLRPQSSCAASAMWRSRQHSGPPPEKRGGGHGCFLKAQGPPRETHTLSFWDEPCGVAGVEGGGWGWDRVGSHVPHSPGRMCHSSGEASRAGHTEPSAGIILSP